MTGLEYLAISDNGWDASPLPDFSALTKLIALSAWNCKLTGEIPAYLYTMTPLQVLDLDTNRLRGKVSPDLSKLKK